MVSITQQFLDLARAAGLRLRARDIELLSRWIAPRLRTLDLPEATSITMR